MSRQKTEKKFLEQGVINEEAMLAYLNNQLDAQEKQQFEKLLKDDVFAQEALEGLQAAQSKAQVSKSLSSINKKVRERTGSKEKKPFAIHWTNYAWAAVLFGLLIGIGTVLVLYMGKKNDNIALNKEVATDSAATKLFENKEEVKPAESAAAPATITDSAPMQQAPKMDTVATLKSKEKTEVTVTTSTANTGTFSIPTTATEKPVTKNVPPPVAAEPAKNAQADALVERKAATKTTVTVPVTQNVVRGGIMEKEETDKVKVVSMDDAMKNFNSGNYKQAGEQFDVILQQQPNNADALYFSGISEYLNGNLKRSEKNFDKLLKEGTKYGEGSKWYKANILIQKGKKEEAKKLLDELSQSGGSYKERAIKKKAEIVF
jgi:hypothetical protein